MRVSVIVPVRNGSRTLPTCLAAVYAQEGTLPPWEVIVVDDGSNDGSGTIAASFGATVLRTDAGGSYHARNQGATVARGEILAFLDADSVPAPDWLRQLDAAFTAETSGVQGVSAAMKAKAIGRLVQWEYEALFQRDVVLEGSRSSRFDTRNCAVRRQQFNELGGFDESFRFWGDADLGCRLRAEGYEIRFAAGVRVEHVNPESMGQLRKKYYNEGLTVTSTLRSKGRRYTQSVFPLFTFVHLPYEDIDGETVDPKTARERYQVLSRRRELLISSLAPVLRGRTLRLLRHSFREFHDGVWRIGSIDARTGDDNR